MNKISNQFLPFVSIIVVNWNGERYLKKLLSILENQTYPKDKYKIIVVDNNSTKDDSINFVKSNFPKIKLIENSKNDGFAGGCNIGIVNSRSDYYLLINNDTKPKLDWLEELVKCTFNKKNVGAIVSKVLFDKAGKENIINNAGSTLFPDKQWPVEEIGANQPDGPEFNKEREITALCGASVLLSKKMLEDIGIFDESFFMYFEDTDLSWRGQKAGWKFYYCPTSIVLHEHSGSSVEHSDFWTFFVTRNRLLVMWKHAKVFLATKVYLNFIKEFTITPCINFIRNNQKKHQLHMLKLGLRIHLSFLKLLPLSLAKRLSLVKERSLDK